jgi:hypothetical protein
VNSTGARANALLVVKLVTARAGELPLDVLQRLGQLLLGRLDDKAWPYAAAPVRCLLGPLGRCGAGARSLLAGPGCGKYTTVQRLKP